MDVCLICTSTLHPDEQGRHACHRCQARIDRDLAALPGPRGLYAALDDALAPGARAAGPRVTGSRGAPVPADLAVLSLIAEGGLVSSLELWVEDWSSHGYGTPSAGGRLQHRLDHAVATLRFNLETACTRHPAIEEFADEIAKIRRACAYHVPAEQEPSAEVTAVCLCGGRMRFPFNTSSGGCRTCGQRYTHEELIELAQQTGGVAA